MDFLGENRLVQMLQSIKQYTDLKTEEGFHTKTVASYEALVALATNEGGQDGNTIYLVGTAAPFTMYVWNGSAYVVVGSGGGTVDAELSSTAVDTILDAAGFPTING